MSDDSSLGRSRSKTSRNAKPAANVRLRAADVLLDKRRLLLSEAQRIAHVGSWMHDRDGHMVWSGEMYRILGVAPRRFKPSVDGMPALIHPDDRTAVFEQFATAFADGGNAEFEFRVVRPDGVERCVIAHIEGAADTTGQVRFLTGTLQDITERRRAEVAVREAAARYGQLFEFNPHPMWIYDPTTMRFLAVNDAAVGHFGYQRDEFLNMTLNDLHPLEQVPPLSEAVHLVDERGANSLWRHQLRDGRLIDMEIIAQTIDFEGQPARVVLAHDVTERRSAAQDVLDSREALRALVRRIQSDQVEERARISRHIHDELGQLLTGLKLDLRWLERRLSEPDLPLALNAMLDTAVAASALADQAIATVQSLAAELRPGALDHLGLAAALAQRVRQFQQNSGIACTLDVLDPLPTLPSGVADELFYICQEALTNVVRHAQATRVLVRLSGQGSEVRLEVEDDGIGIDPATVESRRSLGLLGMRERAMHCGGVVRLEIASPRGTLVVAEVPLREVSA